MAVTIKKSNHVLGKVPTPSPMGKETISVFESIALAVTDIELADVIEYFILPAGCLPVSYKIGATDMDTGGTVLTANFGILNTGETAISTATADGAAAWIANHPLHSTAALVTSDASKAAYDLLKAVTVSTVDRIVGFVVSAAATTAASGTLTLEFSYKAAN
jgi:hypothetical protein